MASVFDPARALATRDQAAWTAALDAGWQPCHTQPFRAGRTWIDESLAWPIQVLLAGWPEGWQALCRHQPDLVFSDILFEHAVTCPHPGILETFWNARPGDHDRQLAALHAAFVHRLRSPLRALPDETTWTTAGLWWRAHGGHPDATTAALHHETWWSLAMEAGWSGLAIALWPTPAVPPADDLGRPLLAAAGPGQHPPANLRQRCLLWRIPSVTNVIERLGWGEQEEDVVTALTWSDAVLDAVRRDPDWHERLAWHASTHAAAVLLRRMGERDAAAIEKAWRAPDAVGPMAMAGIWWSRTHAASSPMPPDWSWRAACRDDRPPTS